MLLHHGQKYIKLGDTTTHGGKVITATSPASNMSATMARAGDLVYCPKCDGFFEIERGALTGFNKDLPFALEGQSTACGATLLASPCSDPEIERKRAETALRKAGGGAAAAALSPIAASSLERQEQQKPKEKVLAALYVRLKNEDNRFIEYLPFRITLNRSGEIVTKEMDGQNPFVGTFKPGHYSVSIKPTPPPGEELGPVPVQNNKKFERTVDIPDGNEEEIVEIDITVTRKEAIEHNIMMTFLVKEPRNRTPFKTRVHRMHFHNVNLEADEYVQKYALEYSLEPRLVHAVLYLEQTQGWYDAFLPGENTIRPMNINIEYWSTLFSARGVTRATLKELEANIREGCFMLHRVAVRAKPNTYKEIGTLYNAHKANYHDKYDWYLEPIYEGQLWLEPKHMEPVSFD